MKYSKITACFLGVWMIASILRAAFSAQLSDEVARLIEAIGEVTIVTNDGNTINAVNILTSAKEQGVPIKFGNKIITDEYSSAVIQTMDNSFQTLDEMTSIQFGTAPKPKDKKVFSFLKTVGSFFLRQSGKEGDYRTDMVNSGWEDIRLSNEPGKNDE